MGCPLCWVINEIGDIWRYHPWLQALREFRRNWAGRRSRRPLYERRKEPYRLVPTTTTYRYSRALEDACKAESPLAAWMLTQMEKDTHYRAVTCPDCDATLGAHSTKNLDAVVATHPCKETA